MVPQRAPTDLQLEVDTSVATLAKVAITVPADEFQKEVQSGLRNVSQHMNMKGFRPGKVPVAVLEKKFGDGIRKEVKESFVQRGYGQAVEEHELKPMAHPRLNPAEIELAEDGSFKVEFEVPLRPTFDLPDYKGLAITSELEPVMDEQIDSTIEEIREQQSTPEAAGEDGIGEKGFVIANLTFSAGEEQVFEREGMRLNAMSVPPGVEAEAFAEGLKDAKEGGQLTFPMTIPDFVENEDARGKEGTCTLDVQQAMILVPPTDEALFELLGEEVNDMDQLRAFVSARLTEAAEERENNRQESQLLDQVLEQCSFDLPEAMLAQQTEARVAQLGQELASSGQSEEDVKKAQEEQRPAAEAEAAKGLRALLVVEAIGEKEELLVSSPDLEAELGAIAARNQTSIEEVKQYYEQNNLGQQLAIEILEKKVRRFLRESADIQTPA